MRNTNTNNTLNNYGDYLTNVLVNDFGMVDFFGDYLEPMVKVSVYQNRIFINAFLYNHHVEDLSENFDFENMGERAILSTIKDIVNAFIKRNQKAYQEEVELVKTFEARQEEYRQRKIEAKKALRNIESDIGNRVAKINENSDLNTIAKIICSIDCYSDYYKDWNGYRPRETMRQWYNVLEHNAPMLMNRWNALDWNAQLELMNN